MRRSLLLLPFCLALATLAGCGNKGPLVLPTHPASASTTAKPATQHRSCDRSTAKPAAPALPASVDNPTTDQY